jgi:uncharacterized protein
MPHRPVIDGFEFARAGSKLSGDWPVSDFPRLRDALYADRGALHYELEGVPEERGRPALHLAVRGTLRLTCQRCLGALDYDLRARSSLLLYASDAELDESSDDAEGPEKVVGGKEMTVHDLIEDEVLLSIPIAPRHEQCTARAGDAPGARQTPFAGLRGLLDGKRR